MNKPLLFIQSAYELNEVSNKGNCSISYNELEINKKYIIYIKQGSLITGVLKKINEDDLILCNESSSFFINKNNIEYIKEKKINI